MQALKKLASAGEVGNENSRPGESFFGGKGKHYFGICHLFVTSPIFSLDFAI
jgi:hypothetical protein